MRGKCGRRNFQVFGSNIFSVDAMDVRDIKLNECAQPCADTATNIND